MLKTDMGTVYPFYPAKLVIGILFTQPEKLVPLEEVLCRHFGPLEYKSESIAFTFSTYYNREMGDDIYKCFFSFRDLQSPEKMVETKLKTNSIEEAFSQAGKRTINLDPGHLLLSKFILTTTKDGSHRIPLHSGIYAEITLLYEKNSFRPVEWTYADFRNPAYLQVLNGIRKNYKAQLKKEFDLRLYNQS